VDASRYPQADNGDTDPPVPYAQPLFFQQQRTKRNQNGPTEYLKGMSSQVSQPSQHEELLDGSPDPEQEPVGGIGKCDEIQGSQQREVWPACQVVGHTQDQVIRTDEGDLVADKE
jgi:hypothetical protein